jgi:hypothetical protein
MGDVAKGMKSFKAGLKDDEPARPVGGGPPSEGQIAKKDETVSS